MIGNKLSSAKCVLGAFAAVVALLLLVETAQSGLIFDSYDAGAQWPATAPVRTTDFTPTALTRGVRSDRIHAQTFQVASAISVDRIFLGYSWEANVDFPFQVRLVEVDDVFATAYTPGTEVAAPVSIPGAVNEPNPDTINNPLKGYALKLHWDPNSSGGQPLTLSPRAGNQGYAIEVVGSGLGGGTSPISMMYVGSDTYGFGRPYEMQNGVAVKNPPANNEFQVAITAVPEPTAAVLAICAALAAVGLARRRAPS